MKERAAAHAYFHFWYLYTTNSPAMGKFSDSIQPAHKAFIEQQHIFFVATAPLAENGRVNVSPKGLDAFRVLGDGLVGYMDLISSGNEMPRIPMSCLKRK